MTAPNAADGVLASSGHPGEDGWPRSPLPLSPIFDEPVHVGRPNLGDRARLLGRIEDLLDRRWLTNYGPYVGEFEQRIAELAGVEHCIATCNATVGLEVAIRATGLTGEVIVPSFTFVATAHALQWLGLTPVFCDIDPKTHNIDVRRAEELITPETTGIIGVHLWGRPCDVDGLTELARRHRLRLLFDAAHAVGCSRSGQMVGGFGDAEVFSFHATKVMNTFEGGAILTNDDALAEQIRLLSGFGFTTYDTVVSVGTNAKMSEIAAAMGLTMLESFDEIVATNYLNYTRYRAELADVPGVSLVAYDERERCTYQYVVLEVDEAEAGLARDELVEALWAENIRARRYFYPGCHRMEPYRTLAPHDRLRLRETERVAERVVVLPTGTGVSPRDVSAISAVIRRAIAGAQARPVSTAKALAG